MAFRPAESPSPPGGSEGEISVKNWLPLPVGEGASFCRCRGFCAGDHLTPALSFSAIWFVCTRTISHYTGDIVAAGTPHGRGTQSMSMPRFMGERSFSAASASTRRSYCDRLFASRPCSRPADNLAGVPANFVRRNGVDRVDISLG